MPGCRVEEGAVVQYAIVAENTVVGKNVVVGKRPEDVENKDEWGIAVVGADCTVCEEAVVPPKMMVEAGTVYENEKKEAAK